ncbi:DUF2249 domain-containing protein [Halobacterium noricense]|uniref:DUF2249 domain-containing protein n=1 Tax=Halobacterium noricense TaxID=223182 RepID=UPI001E36DDC2|nr:DUF2249 domain-containing protein [Halobacterium noricense]UHH24365.1 DUF2249 domain-containing protein [Halobacterium noricense]
MERSESLLVNSFDPEPLYGVLVDCGFTYETKQVAADEWPVYTTRIRIGAGKQPDVH